MDGPRNSTGGNDNFRYTKEFLELEPLDDLGPGTENMWFALKIMVAIWLLLPLVSLGLILFGLHLSRVARRRNGKS